MSNKGKHTGAGGGGIQVSLEELRSQCFWEVNSNKTQRMAVSDKGMQVLRWREQHVPQ